jgi:hypothetical protein
MKAACRKPLWSRGGRDTDRLPAYAATRRRIVVRVLPRTSVTRSSISVLVRVEIAARRRTPTLTTNHRTA